MIPGVWDIIDSSSTPAWPMAYEGLNCFRQLKYDLAWLVDHLLHTCYTSPDNGDTGPPSPSPHTLDPGFIPGSCHCHPVRKNVRYLVPASRLSKKLHHYQNLRVAWKVDANCCLWNISWWSHKQASHKFEFHESLVTTSVCSGPPLITVPSAKVLK